MKRSCAFLTTLAFAFALALAAPVAFAGGGTCDLNGDGACDAADEGIIMAAQGAQAGDADFVAAADYDGDGVITLVDVSAFLDLKGAN